MGIFSSFLGKWWVEFLALIFLIYCSLKSQTVSLYSLKIHSLLLKENLLGNRRIKLFQWRVYCIFWLLWIACSNSIWLIYYFSSRYCGVFAIKAEGHIHLWTLLCVERSRMVTLIMWTSPPPYLQISELVSQKEALLQNKLIKNVVPLWFDIMGVCSRGDNYLLGWFLARYFSIWVIIKILFLGFLQFMCCNWKSFCRVFLSLHTCWIM